MEDKLIQIKIIVRTNLTDAEITQQIRTTLESIPELKVINKLEVS